MSMRTPRNARLLGLGIGLGVCLWSAAGSRAYEEEGAAKPAEAVKASRSVLGSGAKQTESGVSSQAKNSLEKKLDEILANQKTILQRFDQVMEELRIIKVRATLRSGS